MQILRGPRKTVVSTQLASLKDESVYGVRLLSRMFSKRVGKRPFVSFLQMQNVFEIVNIYFAIMPLKAFPCKYVDI